MGGQFGTNMPGMGMGGMNQYGTNIAGVGGMGGMGGGYN